MDESQTQLAPAPEHDIRQLPKLYPLKHILWASVVGGPLAGTWMIATNFRRLGARRKSLAASLLGGSVVALVVILAFALERRFGKTGTLRLGAVLGLAAYYLAKRFQGEAIATHSAQEGPSESAWKSMGVTAFSMILAILGAASLVSFLRPTVVIGGSHEIELVGMATRSDAIRVGEVLTDIGLLRSGGHASVTLDRQPSSWILTVTVKEGGLENASLVKSFESVASALRSRIFTDNTGLQIVLTADRGFKKKTCDLDEGGRLTCR